MPNKSLSSPAYLHPEIAAVFNGMTGDTSFLTLAICRKTLKLWENSPFDFSKRGTLQFALCVSHLNVLLMSHYAETHLLQFALIILIINNDLVKKLKDNEIEAYQENQLNSLVSQLAYWVNLSLEYQSTSAFLSATTLIERSINRETLRPEAQEVMVASIMPVLERMTPFVAQLDEKLKEAFIHRVKLEVSHSLIHLDQSSRLEQTERLLIALITYQDFIRSLSNKVMAQNKKDQLLLKVQEKAKKLLSLEAIHEDQFKQFHTDLNTSVLMLQTYLRLKTMAYHELPAKCLLAQPAKLILKSARSDMMKAITQQDNDKCLQLIGIFNNVRGVITHPLTADEQCNQLLNQLNSVNGKPSLGLKIMGALLIFLGLVILAASIVFAPLISPLIAKFVTLPLIHIGAMTTGISLLPLGLGSISVGAGMSCLFFSRKKGLYKGIKKFVQSANQFKLPSADTEDQMASDFKLTE